MHTLAHAIHGCSCDMGEIAWCVICGRHLDPNRPHVDTCSEGHFRQVLAQQRSALVLMDERGDT